VLDDLNARAGEDDYRFVSWEEFEFMLHGEDYHKWNQVLGTGRSEELAELHAIIQAIEYERSQRATNP
jgi:hypothetical protein